MLIVITLDGCRDEPSRGPFHLEDLCYFETGMMIAWNACAGFIMIFELVNGIRHATNLCIRLEAESSFTNVPGFRLSDVTHPAFDHKALWTVRTLTTRQAES